MRITTVLFDLDGTLLPMDQDEFTKGYFKLLAAQLANQDMTNPMDNSEMMAQMVQMGMMQAMNAMTESMEANTATTAQTYAGSLLGQDVIE